MTDKAARERFRGFLKDTIRQQIDFSTTDQHHGVAPPPIQKPAPADAELVGLPSIGKWDNVDRIELETAIHRRESCRHFRHAPLCLDELTFLLWATQGIRARINAATALRTVPSAGARHALETYLCVMNVTTLRPGVYRYLPLEHKLVRLAAKKDLAHELTAATLGQSFTGQSAVTFVWTAIPYRMEWRYGLAAHKVIALDAGHVCQNLYLACQAIGAGTCAIAAYNQEGMDRLIGVDGKDEFVIYLAPVGKV